MDKKLYKIFLTGVIFLKAAIALPASNGGKIVGFVVDGKDFTPLPNVNLQLFKTTVGAATNSRGFFEIDKIPPGIHRLIVTMMGYKSLVVNNVKIKPGQIRFLRIQLQLQPLYLGDVRITALQKSYPHEIASLGHEVISPRMAVEQAGALEDAYRTMTNLPSVASRNDLNTQLYIRGGSPDQNLILYDGIEILTPSRLFVVMGGGISLVNPDVIETIDLAPGGFGVENGNKMSALIQLKTRDGRRDRLSMRTSASFVTARTVMEGPLPGHKGSWLVAARRSFYDIFANNIYKESYIFPFYFDLHAKTTYDLTPDQKLRFFYTHMGEGAQLYNLEDEQLDLLNKGRGKILGLTLTSIYSPKLTSLLSLGYYTDQNSVKVYDTFNYNFSAILQYSVTRLKASAEINYFANRWLMFSTGSQINFLKTNLAWKLDWRNYLSLPNDIHFFEKYSAFNAFWKIHLIYSSVAELEAGLRYDYSTLLNVFEINPRTKFKFSFSPNFSLWASAGKYSQFPDLLTIIGRGEPLDVSKNMQTLIPEYANHSIMGLDWLMTNRTEWHMEIYSKQLKNLLISNESLNFVPNNNGTGAVSGLELSFQKSKINNDAIGFYVNYSFSKAKYKSRDQNKWIYFDYDQRHRLSLGTDLKVYGAFSANLEYSYGTGFPYTPILGLQKNLNENDSQLDGWEIMRAEKNSQRYPDYHRFDLRLSYSVESYGRGISAYIDIINVFNHKNIYLFEWDFYPSEDTSFRAQRSVIYMLPFLPSFGINIAL